MNFTTKNHEHLLNNIYGVSKSLKSLLIVITLCFVTQTNAQLLKKLGKTAERAAERALEKNVEQKAEKETDKAFDSTFNNSSKKKKKKKKSDIPFSPMGSTKSPESTYRFSHKYVLEMNTGKRTQEVIYYLNNHGDYIASTIPDTRGTNMMTVIDTRKKAMFMFMESNGAKQLMTMDMDIGDMASEAIDDTEYSAKPTGRTKTILGYKAKEFETKGKDMNGTVWVTTDVDVEFFGGFSSVKSKKGMDNSWMKNMKGLLLEMTITDTSKRKPQTITMKCKTLKKQNLTIDTSQYKKMM